jgi:topoisomerase-4 subunit A
MSHLCSTTDLERTVRVNLNVIGMDGRPAVRNLKEILTEWLGFRLATVRRRLEFRRDRVQDRLHILEGLLAAYLNIDKVIKIIREKDEPKPVLMKKFKLSDIQAEAILNLRLRNLARLEEIKIRGEQAELQAELDGILTTLKSKARMNKLVRGELLEAADKFGDERRTLIVERDVAQALSETDLVPSEPVTVILSARGYARAAKGHDIDPRELAYKPGDEYLSSAHGRSNQQTVFVDSNGRAYTLVAHTLPSSRGHGDPLTGRFKPADGASFCGVMAGDAEQWWLVASDSGYGFFVRPCELFTRAKAGKAMLKVPVGGSAITPVTVPGDEFVEDTLVAVVGSEGHLLIFPSSEVPEMARGKGIKLLGVPSKKYKEGEERMVSAALLEPGESIEIHCGSRKMTLKWKELEQRYLGERGRRGSLLPRNYRKVERIATEQKSAKD